MNFNFTVYILQFPLKKARYAPILVRIFFTSSTHWSDIHRTRRLLVSVLAYLWYSIYESAKNRKMLVSNIPLLTVPTFNAAREAFMVKLHPDDIPAHIWTDPETKEFQQKHHVSYLDAAKEILLLRWEQTWYEKNVHNAKQRDLIHEMDERLKAMDPEANFSVRAQITLAQDTTWERVHSYGMFRMEREKFLTQKMIAHLESKEVRIPVPEQLREFLRFVNGGKAEGNRGKEKR